MVLFFLYITCRKYNDEFCRSFSWLICTKSDFNYIHFFPTNYEKIYSCYFTYRAVWRNIWFLDIMIISDYDAILRLWKSVPDHIIYFCIETVTHCLSYSFGWVEEYLLTSSTNKYVYMNRLKRLYDNLNSLF